MSDHKHEQHVQEHGESGCRSVETSWLVRHLHDPDVRVLEVSSSECVYKCGHIPGAQYLALQANVQTNQTLFSEVFTKLRISPRSMVVLYGDQENSSAIAACRMIQQCHPHVCILHGGRERWIEEGRTISREVVRYPSAKPEELFAELNPVAAFQDVDCD